MKNIKIESRATLTKGIVVPWRKVEKHGPIVGRNESVWGPNLKPKGTLLDSGTVFIPFGKLDELDDARTNHSGITCEVSPVYLSTAEECALEELHFTTEQSWNCWHGTTQLDDWLKANR